MRNALPRSGGKPVPQGPSGRGRRTRAVTDSSDLAGGVSAIGGAAAVLPRTRLADIVYDQVFRLIARGEFPEGCKLPPEAELCTRFGVSRPVLRDALSKLRGQGYVQSRRGSGTMVVRGEVPTPRGFPPIRSIADLVRYYEFRSVLEVTTVTMAATKRSKAALADIEHAVAEADDALAAGAYHLLSDLNFAFHRAIARATQNPFYVATLEMIPNFIGVDRLNRPISGAEDVTERARRSHAEHVSILEAIAKCDPDRAGTEMERHIAAACDHILEGQTFGLDKVASL